MDTNSIDLMEAGHELDVLVAERVMGWHHDPDWDCLIPPEQKAKPSEMWTPWELEEQEDEEGEESVLVRRPIKGTTVNGIIYNGDMSKIILPHYSTDIADAWEVAKKLSFYYDSTVGAFLVKCYGWIGECWTAGWVNNPCGDTLARGNTASLAICRAALKAISTQSP